EPRCPRTERGRGARPGGPIRGERDSRPAAAMARSSGENTRMTPSRWPPSVVVGMLVAACQPAPVVRGPTTAVVEAPAPEPAAETRAEAPEPTASECGEWPHDPDDPRVGIYVIDGELDEHDTPRVRTVVIFDGTTVVSWD